jgi:hypothetical protein
VSEVWLNAFLGKIGKYTVTFLVDYYYYLVPVIVVYGIFLTISAYNLKRIDKRVNSEIVNQAKNVIKENPDINYIDFIEKLEIPWEDIVRDCSFFPFISQEISLWVSRTNAYNARKIIMYDKEKIRLVLERSGLFVSEGGNGMRKNLYLDYIHRLTKREK